VGKGKGGKGERVKGADQKRRTAGAQQQGTRIRKKVESMTEYFYSGMNFAAEKL
jgi:hypothetical protein